jgi:hypothetical protein
LVSHSEITLAVVEVGAAPLTSIFAGALIRVGVHPAGQPHFGCVSFFKTLLRDG